MIRQAVQPALEVGQREVGRLEGQQRCTPVGGGHSECSRPLLGVECQRTIEQARELLQIDLAIGQQRAPVAHRNARVATAQTDVLQRPAESPLQRGRGDPNAPLPQRCGNGVANAGIEERERTRHERCPPTSSALDDTRNPVRDVFGRTRRRVGSRRGSIGAT
jgi:hypothetical protein